MDARKITPSTNKRIYTEQFKGTNRFRHFVLCWDYLDESLGCRCIQRFTEKERLGACAMKNDSADVHAARRQI